MTDSPEDEAALDADAKAYHAYDLVKRLRDKNCCDASHCNCDEAADRIEALEAALQKISDVGNEDIPITGNLSREAASLWVCLAQCVDVASAALGEKKDDNE